MTSVAMTSIAMSSIAMTSVAMTSVARGKGWDNRKLIFQNSHPRPRREADSAPRPTTPGNTFYCRTAAKRSKMRFKSNRREKANFPEFAPAPEAESRFRAAAHDC